MLHTLTSPAQIVNGILYVPIYSIFNKTYREHYVDNITADALKLNVSKENGIVISIGGDFTCIFNNHYLFMGDWGIVYNVFPVLMLMLKSVLVNRREEHIFQI